MFLCVASWEMPMQLAKLFLQICSTPLLTSHYQGHPRLLATRTGALRRRSRQHYLGTAGQSHHSVIIFGGRVYRACHINMLTTFDLALQFT